MSLDIRPTLAALLRNRTGALLVSVQIAIALAVLVNAIYIVHQRIEKMSLPTGIDDANLFALESAAFTERFQLNAALQEDLTYLRALPGVVAATPTNAFPLSMSGTTEDLWSLPDRKGQHASFNLFDVDQQGLKTLGARLIAGRDFRAEEVLPAERAADPAPQLIVTRTLAEKLFPHQNALGRAIYDELNHSGTIIGIIEDMIGIGWVGEGSVTQVAIFPELPLRNSGYLVRTQPGRRDAIMLTVAEHLAAANPNRVIKNVHSLEYYKRTLYVNDRAMGIVLITVTALMLAVACLGIFALATFSVSTRTKQIGTRRAVGARRSDIVRYFLIENGLITSAGVVAGCVLALAVGYWLSLQYALPRLDLYYLVGAVLLLCATSQLAAWQPARRAAAIPPSVATRTV